MTIVDPRVAVVTIAHGRRDHLALQQRSLSEGNTLPGAYVVVAMDDRDLLEWRPEDGLMPTVVGVPAHPDGLPLAAARNVGAAAALAAGAEVLVFLDVDCLAGVDLVEAYAEAVLERADVVWSGPVTYLPAAPGGGYELDRLAASDDPHPGRPAPEPGQRLLGGEPDLFWSLSFALHRSAWESLGGFCEDYVGYGGEDTDFGQLVVAAGLDLGWVGSARAYHQHHPVQDPPVSHVDAILRNGRVFRQRWGRWPMSGWLEAFEDMSLVTRQGQDWVRAGSAGAGEPTPGH